MTDIGAKDIFPFPKKPWPPFSKVLKNMKIILKKQETKTQKMAGALAKPVLRGFVKRTTYRMLITSTIAAIASGAAWQYFFVLPRQKALENFYKSYDADKHFNELVKMGYFDVDPADYHE